MKGFTARAACLGVLAVLTFAPAVLAQTGKIAGRVVDASSGDGLPGVNVTIDGTSQGTSSDLQGYYTILNVQPGTYTLRASFIGFARQVVEGVRVAIDQTTTINFELQESVIEGEEVVVTAQRPVVQPDVSASVANIGASEIESLPVSSVDQTVGLQAGIIEGDEGPLIRGSGADEISFNLNGLTLRDERDNTPFTNISLASVEEVQVQTGGFNAEYGNVRSGVVNVVTKEGSPTRYNVDLIVRYSQPSQKHFGPLASDPDSYWIRPYVDPAVAWTGTDNGAWDEATQRQYPEFDGWIATSEELLRDDDPSNDMAPAALQQAFLWQHRKVMEISDPDYNVDVGIGGPLVGLSAVGNTRFYASYRRDESMYLIPQSEDRTTSQTGHLKITSDVGPGMKLSLEGLIGETAGTASSRGGQPGIFGSSFGLASAIGLSTGSFVDTRVYATDYFAPSRVRSNMIGAKFTHALGASTFYEARLTRFWTAYDTNPGELRDETPVVFFGGVGFDEAPFGFQPKPTFGVDGMRTGVGMSNARDTSRVAVYNAKFDLTSQLNRFLQVKSGAELNVSDTRVNYGRFDQFLPSSNTNASWDKTPVRGAVYGQGKLEFKGMVANFGLRLDYFNARDDWFVYDPFTEAFTAKFSAGLDTLLVDEPTDRILTLSPRLGVSFPVTEYSKLFFNYGHFRSMPDPNNLYLIQTFSETGQVSRVANPNNPLPKTIAYELGYEQSLLNQFLIRAAGYYKDVSLQPFLVTYVSRDGQTNYGTSEPNSFEDIRGFELTFSRNRGRWVRGFVNYTYMVYTSGYFGLRRISENPTLQRAFESDDSERRRASSRPVPRPYGRLNVDFLTPIGFGPSVGGFHPLGDWRLSVIGRWRAGTRFTWTGGGANPGVANNVQYRDSWSLDLRLTKDFEVAGGRFQVFADVFNAWNRKLLSFNGATTLGASDGVDHLDYMRSLHLPASPDYPNIPGDDRPGDVRPEGVPFQPMAGIQNREQVGAPDPNYIYYEFESQTYIAYRDGQWGRVDQGRLEQVLDDKAYIDMPNMGFLNFLNPREIFFGIRISL